jgi:hypothetical protein
MGNQRRAQLLNQGKTAFAPEGVDAKRRTPLTSERMAFTNAKHGLGFAPIVASSIRGRMDIAYPENTSLVVQRHLNNFYVPSDWQSLVSKVERTVVAMPFYEVLLIDSLTQRATALALQAL